MADGALFAADLLTDMHLPVRYIQGDQRRTLGRTVALIGTQAEFFLERIHQFGFELFGAGDDESHLGKIGRFAAAEIVLQKGRRGKQQRAFVLAAEASDGFCIQRVGAIADSYARHQRQP